MGKELLEGRGSILNVAMDSMCNVPVYKYV